MIKKLILMVLPLFFISSMAWSTTSNTSTSSTTASESTSQYMDDTGITAKVKSDFLADKDIGSFSISVTTTKGVVTLTGNVASDTLKKKASTIAAGVSGVKSVKNKLVIEKSNQ